jgi:hypothetical protein
MATRARIPFRPFLALTAGVFLVMAGAMVGERTGLGEKLWLDWNGGRAEGRVEQLASGLYRISFTAPEGSIHARGGVKSLGPLHALRPDAPLRVAYNRETPGQFQPVGVSWLPGALAIALFLSGMSLAITARRMALRAFRKTSST